MRIKRFVLLPGPGLYDRPVRSRSFERCSSVREELRLEELALRETLELEELALRGTLELEGRGCDAARDGEGDILI